MAHQPGIGVGIVDQIRIAVRVSGIRGLRHWLDAFLCGWAFKHRTYRKRPHGRWYECHCGSRGGVVEVVEA